MSDYKVYPGIVKSFEIAEVLARQLRQDMLWEETLTQAAIFPRRCLDHRAWSGDNMT